MALKLIFNPISGKFDYIDVTADSVTPYYIPAGTTFTTAENKQTVVAAPVVNDGIWVINGIRVFL